MFKLILFSILTQTSKCLSIKYSPLNYVSLRKNNIRKCFIDDDIINNEDNNNEKFGLRISYDKNSSIYKSFEKNIYESKRHATCLPILQNMINIILEHQKV